MKGLSMLIIVMVLSIAVSAQSPQNVTDSVLAKRDMDTMNARARRTQKGIDTVPGNQLKSDTIKRRIPTNPSVPPPSVPDSQSRYNPLPPRPPIEKQ